MYLSDKQIRMLELLDDQLLNCRECQCDCEGLKMKPYWTPMSEYIILNQLSYSDVRKNDHISGDVGVFFNNLLFDYGLRKEQFLIINSLNFYTKNKPHEYLSSKCKLIIDKYIKIMKPRKMISFGLDSMKVMFGREYLSSSDSCKYYMIDVRDKRHDDPLLFNIPTYVCSSLSMYYINIEECIRKVTKCIGNFTDN